MKGVDKKSVVRVSKKRSDAKKRTIDLSGEAPREVFLLGDIMVQQRVLESLENVLRKRIKEEVLVWLRRPEEMLGQVRVESEKEGAKDSLKVVAGKGQERGKLGGDLLA